MYGDHDFRVVKEEIFHDDGMPDIGDVHIELKAIENMEAKTANQMKELDRKLLGGTSDNNAQHNAALNLANRIGMQII